MFTMDQIKRSAFAAVAAILFSTTFTIAAVGPVHVATAPVAARA